MHALEPRITARVLRSLTALRRQLDREALTEALRAGYQPCSQRNALEAALQHVRTREEVRAAQAQAGGAGGAGEGMEVDTHEDKGKSEESASKDTPAGAAEATPAPAAAPAASAAAGKDDKSPAQDITHEGDMYLRILIIMAIIDAGNARHVSPCSPRSPFARPADDISCPARRRTTSRSTRARRSSPLTAARWTTLPRKCTSTSSARPSCAAGRGLPI